MTYALILTLGFVFGVVATYLVMRRDDKPSDIVADAKAEVEAEEAKAEAALDKERAPIKKDRKDYEAANKIKDKQERLRAKAEILNRDHGGGK